MHRLVGFFFVLTTTQTLFAQEWREDKFVPVKEEVMSYDISHNGKLLVAVSSKKQGARFDLTAKEVKGKLLHSRAKSVVFSPEPQGDFIIFGTPATRYNATGIKDVEIKLGSGNTVLNKAEGGTHFIVREPGWFHVWSFSERLNPFGFDQAGQIVLSHDGKRLIFWRGVKGSLVSYDSGFKHPSSSRSPPFAHMEWYWKLPDPPLAFEDGSIWARLEDKPDTQPLEVGIEGTPVSATPRQLLTSLPDVGLMEGMDKKGVTAIAVSPKGELIAAGQGLHPQSAGSDASKDSSHILLWHKGEAPTAVGVHKSPVVQLQFLDDSRLVSAALDGEIGIWNLASGGSQLLPGHGATKKFVLSVDRKTMVVLQTIKDKEDGFVVFKEEKPGSAPQLKNSVTAAKK